MLLRPPAVARRAPVTYAWRLPLADAAMAEALGKRRAGGPQAGPAVETRDEGAGPRDAAEAAGGGTSMGAPKLAGEKGGREWGRAGAGAGQPGRGPGGGGKGGSVGGNKFLALTRGGAEKGVEKESRKEKKRKQKGGYISIR